MNAKVQTKDRQAEASWRRRPLRWAGGALLGLGLLAVVALAAAPLLLSSDTVRKRVEARLAEITGGTVRLRGGGSVGFMPYMGVSFGDLAIAARQGAAPLLTAERVTVRLSTLAALTGRARLTQVTLVRPRVTLEGEDEAPAVLGARAEPPSAVLATLRGGDGLRTLGTVAIEDGTVHFAGEALTSIDGTVSWSSPDAPIEAALNGVWRGAPATLTMALRAPRRLAAGASSPFEFELDARPLRVSLDGTLADRGGALAATGAVDIASQSPAAAATWLGLPRIDRLAIGPLQVSGDGVIDAASLTLENATLRHRDDVANGRVRLRHLGLGGATRLALEATLAFDTLALPRPWTWDVARPADARTGNTGTGNTGTLPTAVSADLRLSAGTATMGPLTLQRLASTVTLAQGRMSVDIGQGEVGGGIVSGSIGLDGAGPRGILTSDLQFAGVELAPLLALVDAPFGVEARGDVRLRLRGAAGGADRRRTLNGMVSLETSDGVLSGVDLPALAQLSSTLPPMGEASLRRGQTRFDLLRTSATIANGIALLDPSQVDAGPVSLRFVGRADLESASVALRGRLQRGATGTQPALAVPFVIGGTLKSPFFVPLPGGTGPPDATSAGAPRGITN